MDYLRLIGADDQRIKMIETYLRSQGLYRVYDGSQPDPEYSGEVMELDLADIKPCVSGPKRPHDRVEVANMQKDFRECLRSPVGFKGFSIDEENLGTKGKFTFEGSEFEL